MKRDFLLAGDEADELGDAFLHGLLGIFRDLAVGWNALLHDAADVRDWEKSILLPNAKARATVAALVAAAARARWNVRHCCRYPHRSGIENSTKNKSDRNRSRTRCYDNRKAKIHMDLENESPYLKNT
ncbi:hypothetical protein AAC387_Pa07g1047 [Persea americana]